MVNVNINDFINLTENENVLIINYYNCSLH